MPAHAAPVQPAPLLALGPPAHRFDPVESIFAEYVIGWRRVVKGRRPPKLDDKRRRLTLARLRDHTEDDLKAAARGVWHCEWNVTNKQTDFDLVMRDTKHVEKFMACDEPADPIAPPEWLNLRPPPRRGRLREVESLSAQGAAADPFDGLEDSMATAEANHASE